MTHDILVNTDSMKFLKACDNTDAVDCLTLWADILCPRGNYVVIGNSNTDYSKFSEAQLRQLYKNTTGRDLNVGDYATVIKMVADLGRELEPDNTPREKLLERLGRTEMPEESMRPQNADGPPASKAQVREQRKSTGGSQIKPPNRSAAERPKVDGSIRPKPGTKTGRVWEICDHLANELGAVPSKKDVTAACVNEGINPSTAGVQYGKWKKDRDNA